MAQSDGLFTTADLAFSCRKEPSDGAHIMPSLYATALLMQMARCSVHMPGCVTDPGKVAGNGPKWAINGG